jgi:hypothetical protein
MVIFRGERLPGDRRTARLSARRCGTVAAGAACLPVAGLVTGGGARDRRATAHRSRAGRRPESPSGPATHPQLQAANLTPLTNSRSTPRPLAESARAGTARRASRALEDVKKVVTASGQRPCLAPLDVRHGGST